VDDYLSLAIETAKNAGKLVKDKSRLVSSVRSDLGRDIKLQLDFDTEQFIIERLSRKSRFNILSEENGFVQFERNCAYTWIVDPIDGSLNFSRGIPFYCISIGLWESGRPVLGVVNDIVHDSLYYGSIGTQAFMDLQPICVSEVTEKSKAVVATGFPVYTSFEEQSIAEFTKKVREFKKVRLLGSAALSLILVAKGSIEAYMEDNIAIWDVAGAIPIVLAAGGKCEFSKGTERNLLNVRATNGKI